MDENKKAFYVGAYISQYLNSLTFNNLFKCRQAYSEAPNGVRRFTIDMHFENRTITVCIYEGKEIFIYDEYGVQVHIKLVKGYEQRARNILFALMKQYILPSKNKGKTKINIYKILLIITWMLYFINIIFKLI